MSISVIIPTLNEERHLENTLKSIGGGVEVIIADAGSTDSTRAIAPSFTDKVILTDRGRGVQMDRGAREATSEILLFLHADTHLPHDWKKFIEEACKDDAVVGGAFRLHIESKRSIFRIMETMVNLRSKYLGLIYGDQAIFVKRDVFFEVGGFLEFPLMEDVSIIHRLKKKGRVILLDAEVSTSARQWERGGIIKTTFRNLIFLFVYSIGVSPERLYRWYYA